ncbi:MAG: hypothetical protein Q7S84_00060 [bacterium]|nr:hypothetical protein [bacterium]
MAHTGLFDFAIQEVDKLKKHLAKQRALQIRSVADCELIRAYSLAWNHTHRANALSIVSPEQIRKADFLYAKLSTATYKATGKTVYLTLLKEIRAELLLVQGQSFVSGGMSTDLKIPDISKLVQNPEMARLLQRRMQEVLDAIDKSPLTATIMMGAVLEALFLARINTLSNKKALFALKATPKDKNGKPQELKEWGLNDFIEISHEMGWIRKPLKDISAVLRDYRNIIHPVKELSLMKEMKIDILVNDSDAKMFWRVFFELSEQISKSVK